MYATYNAFILEVTLSHVNITINVYYIFNQYFVLYVVGCLLLIFNKNIQNVLYTGHVEFV